MNKPQFGLSFEFFPPKTAEQKVILKATQEQLRPLNPDFFSVTFGAGGSTISATADTVLELKQHPTPKVIPHLSCMGGTPDEISALLDTYLEHGINDILALRGDVPSGMGSVGYFRYANELIEFIHEKYPDKFNVTVGCYPEVHPETESFESEIKYFKQKVEAGVSRAITQFFFNPDAYFNFVDHCEKAGINTPITPGIMPITNFSNIKRFCGFCGTDMPRWLQYKLQSYGDDRKSIQQFGTEFTIKLCQQLLDQGVNGIHFYTLNRAKATMDVVRGLAG
mgnify:CR=1 FL=1